MIKGTSLALNKKLHILNIDAHTDLREPEGRHSGNGFKYAWNDGFLQQYFIFGLHQNYTPEHIFSFIDGEENIGYTLFEDIAIKQKISIREAVHASLQFFTSQNIGLELDMDAIQNMPSSARTSSGFMANDVRAIINQVAENRKVNYLHICEGAPTLTHKKADIKTGKLIAYLITDFIKAQNYFLDEKID
jgi:formiminoglutamase